MQRTDWGQLLPPEGGPKPAAPPTGSGTMSAPLHLNGSFEPRSVETSMSLAR